MYYTLQHCYVDSLTDILTVLEDQYDLSNPEGTIHYDKYTLPFCGMSIKTSNYLVLYKAENNPDVLYFIDEHPDFNDDHFALYIIKFKYGGIVLNEIYLDETLGVLIPNELHKDIVDLICEREMRN